MAGGKGYQGIGAAGGTPDNTSEGKIPVKKGGAFEDSAIQETAEDIESGKNIVAPTASIKFADALILKSNSDSIEILDCARDEKHALIIDIYDDSGSGPPFQRQLQGITTLDLQLLDDDQNGDFSLIAAAVDDIHLETLIIKPKTAGTGIFSMTDSITGCILNTKTEVEFLIGEIDTEVEVVLNNPIILFDNQVIVLNYSGPDLAGHDYVSDPTWGTQFVPFVRTIRQIFITKNLVLEEDIILNFGSNDAIFPATDPASAFSRNGHPVLNYDDIIAERVIFDSKIQAGYGGEDIKVDIDWVAKTATSGAVTWGVEFERNAPGGNDIDSDSFAAQQTANSAASGTSGVITRTTITLTQAEADGITAGDYFRMRLARVVGDGGDNMSDDAQVLRVVVRV